MTAAVPAEPRVGPVEGRQRNRVGVAAFVLVMIGIAAPVVLGIITTIVGAVSGSTPGLGYSVLGGLILFGVGVAFVSPISVAGVVLAIVSVVRRRGRNVLGVVALVLGVLPAITGPLLIRAALETVFGIDS